MGTLLTMSYELSGTRVDQNHMYMVTYGILRRAITKHTAIYGAYIQCWPTLRDTHCAIFLSLFM